MYLASVYLSLPLSPLCFIVPVSLCLHLSYLSHQLQPAEQFPIGSSFLLYPTTTGSGRTHKEVHWCSSIDSWELPFPGSSCESMWQSTQHVSQAVTSLRVCGPLINLEVPDCPPAYFTARFYWKAAPFFRVPWVQSRVGSWRMITSITDSQDLGATGYYSSLQSKSHRVMWNGEWHTFNLYSGVKMGFIALNL